MSKALIKRLISTHAPLAGCDIKHASLNETRQTFQPTHPLRGATVRIMSRGSSVGFQPTHPLRGATSRYHQSPKHSQISTHAPLAGCDLVIFVPSSTDSYFNPRTPCGVRHISLQRKLYKIAISTHAPLAGCDPEGRLLDPVTGISTHAPLAGCDPGDQDAPREPVYFNPRTPCGVRLCSPVLAWQEF